MKRMSHDDDDDYLKHIGYQQLGDTMCQIAAASFGNVPHKSVEMFTDFFNGTEIIVERRRKIFGIVETYWDAQDRTMILQVMEDGVQTPLVELSMSPSGVRIDQSVKATILTDLRPWP